MNRFDVQILVDGEWRWAGVEPLPMTRRAARHCKARMALHPYWRQQARARKFRVERITEGAPLT
jgi:hypothetical protein